MAVARLAEGVEGADVVGRRGELAQALLCRIQPRLRTGNKSQYSGLVRTKAFGSLRTAKAALSKLVVLCRPQNPADLDQLK